MIPPIDVATLPPVAQRLLAAGAPPKMKELAARGIAPGLKPGELLAVLVSLAATPDLPEVAATAKATLAALPEQILTGALGGDLAPAVIDALARGYSSRPDVLGALLARETVPVETVEELASTGDDPVTELIALNEERLLQHPRLIELLYMNKRTRASTADRIVDLAVRNGVELTGLAAWREAAAAIKGELIPEPSEEPTPDDLLFEETQQIADEIAQSEQEEAQKDGQARDTHEEKEPGKEVIKEKLKPLYQRIASMTVSQKVRRAILGTKEERLLLVRDTNRIVSSAAVRSPLLQETDAVMIARNKNMPDEVLRILASTPQWLKSYSVKKSLAENPKTPMVVAVHLVEQLRENDLRALSKSKNVPGHISDAARRHLNRRAK